MLLLLLSLVANATIVNVLSPTVGPPKEGLAGKAKAGTAIATGNEEKSSVSLAAGLSYATSRHTLAVLGSADVAFAFDELNSQKAFGHVRYTAVLTEPVAFFGFVQVDHNAFRALVIRDLVGTGLDVRMWRNDWSEGHVGTALMGEHQVHTPDRIDDDAGVFARSSSYLTLAVKSERVTLASTSFLQPRLDKLRNFRVLQQLKFTVDLIAHLEWEATAGFEYDSLPPDGVQSADLSVKSGLVAKW